jgi:hypothetical protein
MHIAGIPAVPLLLVLPFTLMLHTGERAAAATSRRSISGSAIATAAALTFRGTAAVADESGTTDIYFGVGCMNSSMPNELCWDEEIMS